MTVTTASSSAAVRLSCVVERGRAAERAAGSGGLLEWRGLDQRGQQPDQLQLGVEHGLDLANAHTLVVEQA
jgi:hypothetical protein